MGIVRALSVLKAARVASFPTSREPMRELSPRARAPPIVATGGRRGRRTHRVGALRAVD